uniref:Uncharacterized protein n=1 Tax=Rhizophora mucronata TaxID=61149 RepID=A0A2P2QHV3_RHIMU
MPKIMYLTICFSLIIFQIICNAAYLLEDGTVLNLDVDSKSQFDFCHHRGQTICARAHAQARPSTCWRGYFACMPRISWGVSFRYLLHQHFFIFQKKT